MLNKLDIPKLYMYNNFKLRGFTCTPNSFLANRQGLFITAWYRERRSLPPSRN